MEEHNLLDRSVLEERTAAVTAQYHTLSAKMKSGEQRMAEIKVLQQNIINYAKTRDTYVAYRKAGCSKNSCQSMNRKSSCTRRRNSSLMNRE